jgi:hypothetical protein
VDVQGLVIKLKQPENLVVEVGSFVDVHDDGSFTYPAAAADMDDSSADESSSPEKKKMRVATIEEVFKDLVITRNQEASVSLGGIHKKIFADLGLTFNNADGLEDLSRAENEEMTEAEIEAMHKTRTEVLEDTKGAISVAFSGPTTESADRVIRRLLFPCHHPLCASDRGTESSSHQSNLFTLSHLMPTLVENAKKDYCHACFNKFTKSNMSKTQFRLGVAANRTAERLAVTLEDAMVHPPLENLIFDSYKKLRKDLEGDARKVLVQMGAAAYRRLVMDMLRRRTGPNPDPDASLLAAQTLQDVVAITLSARQALGEARLATVTKSAEFMRVIFGGDDTEVAAGGGYYCQTCWTQPKLDLHWTLAKNCGASLSGWFCGARGCPYDAKRMASLITFADKTDPEASFVMNTRMPTGTVANMLSAIKVINCIRMGECAVSKEDARKAGGLGNALKSMIVGDNERYFRLFGKLRAVQTEAILTRPNLADLSLPAFEILEGVNDVTLKTDFGRGCVVSDVGKLFDREEPADPSAEAWKGMLQVVLAAWGVAEAGAIHPDLLHESTQCSKKTLTQLRSWTYIRATGHHAPVGTTLGKVASVADKAWASQPFANF